MIVSKSIRLYELTLEIAKDKDKAKEYIDKLEEIMDDKLVQKAQVLATKQDLSHAKPEVIKWYIATVIAVVGLVMVIVRYF